jgi:hypothetical protein
MVEPRNPLPHGRHYLRMGVTQNGAHLARGEIEHASAAGVIEERAFGAIWHEVAAISQEMTRGARPHLGRDAGGKMVHVDRHSARADR